MPQRLPGPDIGYCSRLIAAPSGRSWTLLCGMPFSALPVTAAWQHRDAREGFEVAWFRAAGRGYHLSGCTTGAEDGQTWVISYAIELDQTWTTRSARITGQSAAGIRHARLQADGRGHWRIDGQAAPIWMAASMLTWSPQP